MTDAISVPAPSKKAHIATVAAELFERDGYAGVNVQSIAEAAGLRKATLYHYFRSKDEILRWIHDDFVSELLQRQQEHRDAHLSPSQALLACMTDILTIIAERRGQVRVFFENRRELGDEDRDHISRKREQYRDGIESFITDGILSGEFRRIDARLACLAFFGLSDWPYQWFRNGGSHSPEELAQFFTDIFLRGLATDGTAAPA